ncbi:MAG TPA: hypothetical protein VES79_08055 [Solirubrobacteraceae bacterium]|nr:hypothetical protein [Solirubrobacteraceae bacterium]
MAKRTPLTLATLAFVATVLLHGLDHVLQDRGVGALTTEVLAGGTVIFALSAAMLVLALREHPQAPLFAAGVGLSTTIGVSLAHLAPHWSAFSDPYADLSLGAWSWTVMLAEIAAALVLASVGLRDLRDRRPSARHAAGSA